MDPITAAMLAIKATAEMVTEIVKGQPIEVKMQLWKWYVEDVSKIRKALKLE